MFRVLVEVLANLLSIVSNFMDPKKLLGKLKGLRKRQALAAAIVFALILTLGIVVYHRSSSGALPVAVTEVTLSENSMEIGIGDTGTLSANVLYSDNTVDHDVLWVSSNKAVVCVDESGNLTALAEGTAIITAQAARNNTTARAQCDVTVKASPSGYSISVRRTALDCYVYIYIQPYEADVTRIRLYAEAPSGQIFCPDINENDLYRFYSETGTWTVYASIESENGIYEAKEPEDFVTIEINDISATAWDALFAGLPVS